MTASVDDAAATTEEKLAPIRQYVVDTEHQRRDCRSSISAISLRHASP